MTGHDLNLDAIKARTTAATPGPWMWDGAIWQAWADGESVLCAVARAGLRVGQEDAEFMAHARADIPALVAEVESLRAKIAAAEQDYDARLAREIDKWGGRLLDEVGRADRAEAVVARVRRVLDSYAKSGYPDALISKGQVLAEFAAALMDDDPTREQS